MSLNVFYHGSTAISPHRQESKSHGDLTATRMKTQELAEDVKKAVEQDLTLHYRVTDTEEFLNRLLPVQKTTLDTILQYMKNENLYNSEAQRWRGFPDPARRGSGSKKKEKKKKSKENSMYGPFCAIAEAIRKFAEHQRSSFSEMGSTKWVDYHSKSPMSENAQAAQLRPDALFAFESIAHQTVLEESQQGQREAEEEADAVEEGEAKEGKDEEQIEGEKKEKEKEKDIALQLIWWLQIVAAVEMKRSDSQNWQDVVKQLFGYLRRILREQLDRRFVFGLTLGPDMMTVWLHDRSGVIGTKSAINIHKEPLKFIQVIASFSLLSPESLGFDPTIGLLVSPNLAVPSYKPNEQFIRAYQAAPHNRQWVIKMNDGSKYVTIETVSSVRAGFMRGRGSIVWVVVPFEETKEKSKVFVLKQSWRPREVDSEGDLYEKSECDHVGKIELCEEVLISDRKDATDTLIRESLDDSTGLGKRPRDEMPEGEDPSIHVTYTDIGDIEEVITRETGPPLARVRTRVLLSTYGWLIKYFSTRRELLVVLQDAIRGHKYLYKNGVLHRDISPGNILIKWRPGSETTSGCLIDLDHAKRGKLVQDEVKSFVDDKMISRVQAAIHAVADVEVEREVARLSLRFYPMKSQDGNPTATRVRAQNSGVAAIVHAYYGVAAIVHASKFRPFTERLCTPEHLRWKPVEISYHFDFSPTERRKGSITGTPPYTSGEILSGCRYFDHDDNVFHDAVHDLESFFWVLVHICLTRQGPGGVRREELEQKNQAKKEYGGLRRVIHCFFDSDMSIMAANKSEIFKHPSHFDQYILDNFHGYFQPLRDLVKEWFYVLILAHKFHAFEYHDIHDMVLEILDRALESAPPEDINEAAQKVFEDRKTNIQKLLDGNPFGKVQQSPAPHTSPTSQRHVAQAVYRSPPSSPTPAPKKGRKRRR